MGGPGFPRSGLVLITPRRALGSVGGNDVSPLNPNIPEVLQSYKHLWKLGWAWKCPKKVLGKEETLVQQEFPWCWVLGNGQGCVQEGLEQLQRREMKMGRSWRVLRGLGRGSGGNFWL